MAQADAAEHLLGIGSFLCGRLSANLEKRSIFEGHKLLENQLVLSQCACLVGEDVIDVAKFFVKVHCVRFKVLLNHGVFLVSEGYFNEVCHVNIAFHHRGVEQLSNLNQNEQIQGHTAIEQYVKRPEDVEREFSIRELKQIICVLVLRVVSNVKPIAHSTS